MEKCTEDKSRMGSRGAWYVNMSTNFKDLFGVDQMSPWTFRTGPNIKDLCHGTNVSVDVLARIQYPTRQKYGIHKV